MIKFFLEFFSVCISQIKFKKRIVELLDLPDEVLIIIFKNLNHHDKLKSMLVCQRFENLIGNEILLCGNFQLKINCERSVRAFCKDSWSIRRRIGSVLLESLNNYDLNNSDSNNFKMVCDFLENVRPISVTIGYFRTNGSVIFKLLDRLENLQELKLYHNTFVEPAEEKLKNPLKNLKNLELIGFIDDINFLDGILAIDTLDHLFIMSVRENNKFIHKILINQKKMKSLTLWGNSNLNFYCVPESQEMMELHELCINKATFSNKESFENFVKFIKTQKKISKLFLILEIEDDDHNYSELFTHLLNLKTLKTLHIRLSGPLKRYQELPIFNPHLKTLQFNISGTDKSITRFFPNLTSLDVDIERYCDEWIHLRDKYLDMRDFDLTVFNSLKFLVEFKISSISVRMLERLKLENLKKFTAKEIKRFDEVSVWSTFALNNPQTEYVKLGMHRKRIDFILDHMKNILENLPNLTTLKLVCKYFKFDKKDIYMNIPKKTFPKFEIVNSICRLDEICYKRKIICTRKQ